MKKCIFLYGLLCVGSVNAAVIDFQVLEHLDTAYTNHGSQYIEGEFQINTLPGSGMGSGLGTIGTLALAYSGSTALYNEEIDGIMQLNRIDGGLFDLLSIDLAELNGDQITDITFTTSGGHTQTFTLDGVAFNAETFIFNNGFLGVTNVSWVQQSFYHQFDNIVVNATSPVPVPAAVWLFGSGLVGLIGMKKKSLKTSILSV